MVNPIVQLVTKSGRHLSLKNVFSDFFINKTDCANNEQIQPPVRLRSYHIYRVMKSMVTG